MTEGIPYSQSAYLYGFNFEHLIIFILVKLALYAFLCYYIAYYVYAFDSGRFGKPGSRLMAYIRAQFTKISFTYLIGIILLIIGVYLPSAGIVDYLVLIMCMVCVLHIQIRLEDLR